MPTAACAPEPWAPWWAAASCGASAARKAAGAVALVIAGYIAASDRDVDATTEAAALIVVDQWTSQHRLHACQPERGSGHLGN